MMGSGVCKTIWQKMSTTEVIGACSGTRLDSPKLKLLLFIYFKMCRLTISVQHNLAANSTRQLPFVRSRRILLWTAKRGITPPCTQQRQHPQTVKFHRERAFINTSHSSTGLPTEDYGELAGMPSPRPRPERGASPVAKHGEQKDQRRLDTCIPNTRG